MKFEFSVALKYMHNRAILVSDDTTSNSAVIDFLADQGLPISNVTVLKGNGPILAVPLSEWIDKTRKCNLFIMQNMAIKIIIIPLLHLWAGFVKG